MPATLASHWFDPYLSPPPERATSGLATPPTARGRLDVLVVEDHASTRRAMELALGHLGHLVFAAGTVEDARKLLCGFAIDVVVCDYALPDGDATTLLPRWPEDARRVPTLAISGVRDAGVADRCRRAGFDAFLPKPLHVDALDQTLRRLARGRE